MKVIGNFFLSTLVGLGLTFLIATFIEGGYEFILISIICTAFISLVIWIPIWFTLGFVFLSIIRLCARLFMKSKPKPQSDKPPIDPNLSVLSRYIRSELAKGRWNLDQIDQKLRSNGWSDEAIEDAHRSLGISSS